MSPGDNRRSAAASAALVAAVLAWLLLMLGLVWWSLDERLKAALGPLLLQAALARASLLLLAVVLLAVGASVLVRALLRHAVLPARQLADHAQLLLRTDSERELAPQGSLANRQLTEAVNGLAAQRTRLRREVEERVREGSRNVELEKNRLAALMAELTQSVVVCNLDGRILLYNQRARLQFRALSQAPGVAGGAELIGLGRSIYAVFDRKLVTHALENIQQRMLRGVAQPSAQFVTTTASGQLLRAQMAPVHPAGGEGGADDEPPGLSGFVLMLDNITREHEAEAAKDQLLHTLTERSRSALANMQAALDMLDYPDLDASMRDRFMGVVRDETRALAQRIGELDRGPADGLRTRWPLEDMLGADLVGAALRRIETVTGLPVSATEVDGALWLRVESFSLLQALVSLTGRLVDEFGVRYVQLRLAPATGSSGKAWLDLVWSGQAMSTETVMSWELDPMRVGSETLRLSVRDVVERHNGAFWFERERVRHQAFFRFLLPQANPQAQLDAAVFLQGDSRPEYYDFDLFRSTEYTRALDERPLAELTYTVFDTETTGLNPSQGDEILQIGAARIVNGRLLRQEGFEQLVNPVQPIPPASIAIHGIQPAMVAGQPRIEQVLPAFHAFARDTVLVAHNAAFDMRFLQVQEPLSGVVFDQPVLDTLLLSALLNPHQASHRLEALAERFGLPVIGRHTALGDAMLTAEVFLKLLPLLAARGIHTLGQAREAAQQTYLSRLTY